MRILIVEDNKKLADSLKKGLKQEAYAVDVVYDGDEGQSFATTETYDLVILDRMIPGRYDGMQILESMREAQIDTPVMFLTAKDKVNDKVDGLNAGADDYLVKPFAFTELLARIQALLRRPASAQEVTLSYKDLSLDSKNFTATREDSLISLTATEFALLDYLMRNKGKILTKQNLIEHVWDYDADILPNTVEAYIGYLRTKIDRPFTEKYLVTKRGFGYIFGQG